ncbi:MAG: hypothetical protein CL917_09940 [Deltaproteobacteria bacterium]|nr:hypothetical protein [Deltaproteobacteria bacterium]
MRRIQFFEKSLGRDPGKTLLLLCMGLLLLVMSTACTTQLAPPPVRPTESAYLVGPPDRLLVTILPAPEIEREAVVRPDGRISIDLIGDVQASGRTVEAIGAEIEKRVARYKRDAHVTVSVAASVSLAVTVLGEVRVPGTFPLTSETRVSQAVGLRGGTTMFGAKSKVRLIRTNGETTQMFIINLSKIENGDLSSNMVMRGGDMLIVPPNVLARIGYAMQVLLFPFQPILGTASNMWSVSRIFIEPGR